MLKIFLKHLLVAKYLNLNFKALIHLPLFECKHLKFTFMTIFYINNAWILLRKVDKLWFLAINEIIFFSQSTDEAIYISLNRELESSTSHKEHDPHSRECYIVYLLFFSTCSLCINSERHFDNLYNFVNLFGRNM